MPIINGKEISQADYDRNIQGIVTSLRANIGNYNRSSQRIGLITDVPDIQKIAADYFARSFSGQLASNQRDSSYLGAVPGGLLEQYIKPFTSDSSAPESLGLSAYEKALGTKITTQAPESVTGIPTIAAKVPDAVSSIRNIFGPEWNPAPVFEQKGLTGQGIYGAVRIKGMNDVYTLGPGGTKETAESYLKKFGTAEQKGIVGEITPEQAGKLGIKLEPTKVDTLGGTVNLEDIGGAGAGPDLPNPQAPTTMENFVNSVAANADTTKKALTDRIAAERASLATQKADIEKKITDLTKEKSGAIGEVEKLTAPFREELEKTERARLKVEDNYFKNQQLTDELDTLLTSLQSEVESAKNVTGLASIRNPRIAKIQEDVASRVGVIEAVMAARNNQISTAYTLIDRSANAIIADRQDRLNYYKTVFDFLNEKKGDEEKKLSEVNTKDKAFLTSQISMLENEMNEAQASVDFIKNLMTDSKTADLAAQAGLSLNDSASTINKKLSDYAYKEEIVEQQNKQESDGYQQLITSQQISSKPESELVRLKDSRGVERIYWKPAEVAKTSSNTLTLSEAEKFGFPMALVGKSEQQIIQDLSNPTPPDWFKKIAEEKTMSSLIPQELKTQWDVFRSSIMGEKQTTESGIDFENL